MTTTTYTVISNASGEVLRAGLSAVDAAIERLNHDGAEYRIVPKEALGWELQVRKPNAGRREWTLCWDGPAPYGKPIWENGATEDEAFAAMTGRVISADWNDNIDVATDVEYEAMLAEITAEADA